MPLRISIWWDLKYQYLGRHKRGLSLKKLPSRVQFWLLGLSVCIPCGVAAVGKSSAIIKLPILNSDATILSCAGRYPTYSAQKGRRLSSMCDYLGGKPVREESWSPCSSGSPRVARERFLSHWAFRFIWMQFNPQFTQTIKEHKNIFQCSSLCGWDVSSKVATLNNTRNQRDSSSPWPNHDRFGGSVIVLLVCACPSDC